MIDTEEHGRKRPGGRSTRVARQVREAVLQILAEGNEAELTMALIAERSSVHLSTLYRRWESLEAIMFEVASAYTTREIPLPSTGALATDLLEFQRGAVAFARSPTGCALLRSLPAAEDSYRDTYWQQRFARLRPMFDAAEERGELDPGAEPARALEVMTGTMYFMVLFRGGPIDDELVVRISVNAALATLGRAPLPRA